MASIKVFLNKEHIANLSVDSDFNYSFDYLDSYTGFDISPNITKNGSASSNTIKNFLQNLLPEGRLLEDVLKFTHISKDNIFALISKLGFESSGALKFVNSNNNRPIFREISENELIERIEQIDQKSIAIWDSKPRLSLAGVQDKLAVIYKDGKLGLANGSLSSTHILKFQTLRFSNIVLNEHYCMNLAKSCGIDSANCEIKRYGNYLVLAVERFDRVVTQNGIERLHIIDANQLLDLAPLYKYERAFGKSRDVADIREGVSFKKLFNVANSLKVPAVAKLKMLDWALFNLIVGNSDAHGKNISFFVTNSGIEIAPFYDILSTIIYKDIEHDLAMAFGDEFNIKNVLGFDLVEFAYSIGLPKQLVSNRLSIVAKAIIDNLDANLEFYTSKEIEFINNLKEHISKRAKKYLDISKEMLKVSN